MSYSASRISPADFWSDNLAIIKNRWPDLASVLAASDTPQPSWELIDRPERTLIIDGLQLTSRYDRRREAALQASLVPAEASRAWVYGPALGDLPRILLERPDLKQLTVVILNPALTRLSFTLFDHGDWLADPRVSLSSVSSDTPLQRPFAASSVCLLLASEQAGPLRDRVFLELATPHIRRKHQGTPHFLKRLEQNATFVARDRDVAELFGSQTRNTLVVAAAGPTLSDHYAWLAAPNRPTLIAVDAALKPLLQAKIVPDFIISIDSHQELYQRFFYGIDTEVLRGVGLIYFPVVDPQILKWWPGERFVGYPGTAPYRQLTQRFPKAELFSSGSVLHPAVDLAVSMGADRIILAGADFSLVGPQSHVAGSAAIPLTITNNRHWVLNGFGERVTTTPNLRGFLRDLEDYLARQQEVTFVNGSKKGAAIRHTVYQELRS